MYIVRLPGGSVTIKYGFAGVVGRTHSKSNPIGRLSLLLFQGASPPFTGLPKMLSDRIWVTRKARINTERRLLRNSLLSEILLAYYSLFVVVLSIWNFTRPNEIINLLLLSASVVVLVLSVFLSSQRFRERALAMRNCYVRLGELQGRAKTSEDEHNKTELDVIDQLYRELLISSENHTETDYLSIRHALKNDINTTLPPFTKTDLLKFWISSLGWWVLSILIFLLPFGLIFFVRKVCS